MLQCGVGDALRLKKLMRGCESAIRIPFFYRGRYSAFAVRATNAAKNDQRRRIQQIPQVVPDLPLGNLVFEDDAGIPACITSLAATTLP